MDRAALPAGRIKIDVSSALGNRLGKQRRAAAVRARLIGLLCASALTFEIGLGSVACRAAELPEPALAPGIRATLASVVLLSDAAMAKQKGAGMPAPSIANDSIRLPRIMLWDELKTGPQIAPSISGTATNGAAGK